MRRRTDSTTIGKRVRDRRRARHQSVPIEVAIDRKKRKQDREKRDAADRQDRAAARGRYVRFKI